jgi:hypothetical protein
MTTTQKKQLEDFRAAKLIAFEMPKGHYRRAKGTNYCGYMSENGQAYVIGDTDEDVQNPDAIIGGKPAREVFEGFTVMKIR